MGKIVCIDNRKCIYIGKTFHIIKNEFYPLTIGKIYNNTLKSKSKSIIIINDDNGYENIYNKKNFITLDEYRNNKINEILK